MAIYNARPGLWDQIEDFAQRQPTLFVASAVAGGLLLGYLMKGEDRRSGVQGNRSIGANFSKGVQGNQAYRSSPMPSSRLGATEDQITRSMQQSVASAVSKDDVSTTGTAYDLDPKSITAG